MYIDENGNIYTRSELETYYNQHRNEIEVNSGAETFEEYLGNCLSKNGNLEEWK